MRTQQHTLKGRQLSQSGYGEQQEGRAAPCSNVASQVAGVPGDEMAKLGNSFFACDVAQGQLKCQRL